MPNGRTDDPDIPRVWSAVDYIARRLAIDWLPYPDRAALGVYTLTERASSPALITSSTSRSVSVKSNLRAASSGSAS
jgi:hypothetical protein